MESDVELRVALIELPYFHCQIIQPRSQQGKARFLDFVIRHVADFLSPAGEGEKSFRISWFLPCDLALFDFSKCKLIPNHARLFDWKEPYPLGR
jgi:hypothetical protein